MGLKQHNHTSLKDKRILVTGGTTGIGRATVSLLVSEGADVLTFGRNEADLEQALAEARQGDGSCVGLTADAATREGMDAVFAAVDEELGGIDMLVACAALGAQPLHEMAEDDWRFSTLACGGIRESRCRRHSLRYGWRRECCFARYKSSRRSDVRAIESRCEQHATRGCANRLCRFHLASR